jgi:aldehyde:ferredoxin oxidoreductase
VKTHCWYHKRLALADMAAERFSIVPLREDLLAEALGGAALGSLLHARRPDAFILCAGPLTGGFAPASGLAAAVFRRNDDICRLPVLQGIGAMLRQSGVDALAIAGRAKHPLTLRLGRGTGRLERAKTPLFPDYPRAVQREELLRTTQDGNAALLLAGSGTSGLRGAGTHFGAAEHASELAGALRDRNCAALAFEGGSALPPMPVPVDAPLRARLASAACFAQECAAYGAQIPAGMSWKSAACYHCPSPCHAWVKRSAGDYVYCADHRAFAALINACGAAAPDALALCDAYGLDPLQAAPLLANAGIADMPAMLEKALDDHADPGGAKPAAREEMTESARAGMILGICPHLLRRNPSVTLEDLLDLPDADMRRRLPVALGI